MSAGDQTMAIVLLVMPTWLWFCLLCAAWTLSPVLLVVALGLSILVPWIIFATAVVCDEP
jgi:hypothetical protein